MSHEAQTPTSPLLPVAPYPPLPSPNHHSRAPEFYGFAAWTSTSFLLVLFLLWALLPDAWLLKAGIEWYPSREWALLLPSYSIFLVLLTYFVYFALAIRGTPSFSDMRAITDSHAHFPEQNLGVPSSYLAQASSNGVQELYDIPIGVVNRVVYSPHRIGSKQ